MMKLRECVLGSGEYAGLLILRYDELREPLGLEWSEEDLTGEGEARHFGLYEGDELVGVVLAREVGEGVMKLRQIAVLRARQGGGVGRVLMGMVEARLAVDGVGWCELNARVNVAEFYEKVGYVRVGEVFEEVGMAHVKMRKGLVE